DGRRGRFFLFFSLTLAGNVGLIVAGDMLGFYLFFALMTFAAYGLVVHAASDEALRAGRIYIVMAILGEVALLAGLFSLGGAFGGVPTFGGEMEATWVKLAAGEGPTFGGSTIALLLAAGFGVKAGLIPLHLWLPLAHPVAPTAASALLSGAMIKAGLLGWVRMLPAETALPEVSGVFLAVGAAAALYGVVVGIFQDDPKTVLAYSSVSQMGYMAMGTGLLVARPELIPWGGVAVAVYAMHHGIAKGALFLSVGLADRVPGQWWILPGTAIPALALAGLPLTTGALAKNTLKGGLEALGGPAYTLLDLYLPVAALGTTLLLARFLVTLRERSEAADPEGGRELPLSYGTWTMVVPWAFLVLLVAGGTAWLPQVMASPDGVTLPGPDTEVMVGLVPVLLGAVLAGLAVKASGKAASASIAARIARLRIPAGDILVLLEALLRRLPLPDQEAGIGRLERKRRRAMAWARLQARRLDRLAAYDVEVVNTSLLGVILVLLAAGLILLVGGIPGV
ncbi:MAG: NADH/ubiquinone/plastoquinone (complex I), partial [Gemmatimonadales bacterium]